MVQLDDLDVANVANEVIESLGGPSAVARAIGVSPQAVSQWRAHRIPVERVITLERLLGGRISRHEMRPDLYPRDEHTAA